MSWKKHVLERKQFVRDFSARLSAGVTISTVDSVLINTDPKWGGTDLTSELRAGEPAPTIGGSGTTAEFWCKADAAQTKGVHSVFIQCTLSDGSVVIARDSNQKPPTLTIYGS